MIEGVRLAAGPSLAGGAAGECSSLRPPLNKVLALPLELCLPKLVSSPVPAEGSIDGLRAFSRNPGRRASPMSLLLSTASRAQLSVPPNLWPDAERRGVELSPWLASWRRSASGSGSARSPSHTHREIEARIAAYSAELPLE